MAPPPTATHALGRHLLTRLASTSGRGLPTPPPALRLSTRVAAAGWPGNASSHKRRPPSRDRATNPAWDSDSPGPRHNRRNEAWVRDEARRPPPPRHQPNARPAPPPPPTPPGSASYFATCHPGNEQFLAAELAGPRIRAVAVHPGRGGVSFASPRGEPRLAVMHRANLWSRIAVRVLHVIGRGSLGGGAAGGGRDAPRGGDRLYLLARRCVDWPALLPPGGTLCVDARVSPGASDLATPGLVAARVRDAVCDAVRDATGARPPPPAPPPPGLGLAAAVDLPLLVAADGADGITFYRDCSGQSLHKRGYRTGLPVHAAALNEAAAAGVLAAAGWAQRAADAAAGKTPPVVLADPMCGSGTLLIEAALAATHAAPGLARPPGSWPFERWPDHDSRGWAAARGDAARARVGWEGGALLGNDTHGRALDLARAAADAAGVGHLISWSKGTAGEWAPERRPTLVVTNPPWGGRLAGTDGRGGSARAGGGESDSHAAADLDWDGDGGGGPAAREDDGGDDAAALEAAWADLGAFLRKAASPSTAFVLCGNPAATRALRMRAASKARLALGGADARLLRYEVLPPLPPGGLSLAERDGGGPPHARRGRAAPAGAGL